MLGNRYELDEIVGRGGMADVYRGVDRTLRRPVAVKVLREGAEDESDRARFTTEARTLARLSHAGLVTVLDAGITEERPFLVLELVDGPTLAEVSAEGPIDADRVAGIGAQLADALAYAHEQGVVHRDVKPANVLLATETRVKLADFGIARLIGDTVRHTRTGQAIGTAAYLAPEQVRGEEVTPAADIYSLGLVLLEALTGERAYPGAPSESALARLSRQPEVPSSLPWRDLLAQMTALDPTSRPDAREVARRLRGTPERTSTPTRPLTVPVPTKGPSAAERWLRTLRELPRHQLGAGLALLAIVVLLVIIGVLAGTSGGGGGKIPAHTPPALRQPLSQLHDAVEGG